MIVAKRPGETRAQFLARSLAAARRPTSEDMDMLRHLLPPIRAAAAKAA